MDLVAEGATGCKRELGDRRGFWIASEFVSARSTDRPAQGKDRMLRPNGVVLVT